MVNTIMQVRHDVCLSSLLTFIAYKIQKIAWTYFGGLLHVEDTTAFVVLWLKARKERC